MNKDKLKTRSQMREMYAAEERRKTETKRGKVFFDECNVCGAMIWTRTAFLEEDSYQVTEIDSDNCPHCKEIIQRAPELHNWIMCVMCHSLRQEE